jgi:hypothetical protein
VQICGAAGNENANTRFRAMTRRGFHILLALILVACVLSPYVELSLNWGQSLFDTGYDTETTVAVIALLLILAFALATLLAHLLADTTDPERLVDSPVISRITLDFSCAVPEFSPPPLSLRI